MYGSEWRLRLIAEKAVYCFEGLEWHVLHVMKERWSRNQAMGWAVVRQRWKRLAAWARVSKYDAEIRAMSVYSCLEQNSDVMTWFFVWCKLKEWWRFFCRYLLRREWVLRGGWWCLNTVSSNRLIRYFIDDSLWVKSVVLRVSGLIGSCQLGLFVGYEAISGKGYFWVVSTQNEGSVAVMKLLLIIFLNLRRCGLSVHGAECL